MKTCPGHGKGWTRDYSTDTDVERWVCAWCLLPSAATAARLGEQ